MREETFIVMDRRTGANVTSALYRREVILTKYPELHETILRASKRVKVDFPCGVELVEVISNVAN